MGFIWAGVLLAALLLFWAVGAYNRIMQLRNRIGDAYAKLDQHLTTRGRLVQSLIDLLHPELVTEQAAFDALHAAQVTFEAAAAQARARPAEADPVSKLTMTGAVLAGALARLLALLDQHAELRNRADLKQLIEELKLNESQHSFARQLFNEAASAYNEALKQVPTRALVGVFGFKPAHSL